jgi:hypothetical protein
MAKTVVYVGCKIPTGLNIQLRDPNNPSIVLAGCMLAGSAMDMQPYVKPDGIGLTPVDADLWEAWEKWAMESKFAPYMNGFVFAAERETNVRSEAREKISDKTQMEGLDVPLRPQDPPSSDPRLAEFKLAPTVDLTLK